MDELDKLRVLIEAETKQYRDQMDEIIRHTRGMSNKVRKETSGVKDSFSKMAGFIKKAVFILGTAKIGKDALGIASDMQETEAVVDMAFGSMRKHVDDFAKNSIQTHGMSSLSAKQTAGDYMLMSKGMGMADENAAKMSVAVAKLSADMASLKNTSQEMAQTALSGIWTGETEALKKYGIVMTQANLQEYAQTQGITTKIQAMSQQEQVMLRYSYIMDSMSMAQGNFMRESQGYAAQTKILSEQWKELLGIIGAGLMHVVLPVIRLLNQAMSYLITFARTVGQVLGGLFGIKGQAESATSAIAPMGQSMGGLADNAGNLGGALNSAGDKGSKGLGKIGDAAEKAGKKAKGALAPFDDLNVLTQSTAEPSGGVGVGGLGGVGGGGGLGGIPIPDFGAELEGPRIDTTGLDSFVTKARDVITQVKNFIIEHKELIIALFAGIVAGIIAYLKAPAILSAARSLMFVLQYPVSALKGAWAMLSLKGTSALTAMLSPAALLAAGVAAIVAAVVYLWQTSESFRNSIIDTFNNIKDLFMSVIGGIQEELSIFWSDYGQPIMEGLAEAWQNWVTVVDSVWKNILKPIFDALIDRLQLIWENILQPALGVVLTLLGEVITIVLKLWNEVLAPLITWLTDKLAPAVEWVTEKFLAYWTWLTGAIKPVIDGIGEAIKGVSKVLQGVIDFLKNIFTGNWEGAWNAVVSIAEGVVQTVGGFFGGLWDGIVAIFSPVIDFFGTAFGGAVDAIKGAWSGIKEWFGGIWDGIVSIFQSGGRIFDGIVDGVASVFLGAVNAIISGINWVIRQPFDWVNGILNTIKDIDIPIIGKPFYGFWGYNPVPIPQIPQLAVGTNRVERSGLAMIHEGEAVVPKKYNPALTGNSEQVALLEEQNSLLRALLEKDNNVYLDGDELHSSNEKRRKEQVERFGYSY